MSVILLNTLLRNGITLTNKQSREQFVLCLLITYLISKCYIIEKQQCICPAVFEFYSSKLFDGAESPEPLPEEEPPEFDAPELPEEEPLLEEPPEPV